MEQYPLPAFYFSVSEFGDATPAEQDAIDASFQEVSGLTVEQTFEEVVEGGENRFVHRLPKAAKYKNLVLKRGVLNAQSGLAKWFADSLEGNLSRAIETKNLQIQLLDENGSPAFAWSVYGCYPAKWQVGSFNSGGNKIAVETLELAFTYFDRRKAFGPARR
jgi:phage tail-like protein